jgi:hypothetical protein
MTLQVILMCAALLLGIVALLSSRFVRAVFLRSILYPRHQCELEVSSRHVRLKHSTPSKDRRTTI